MASSLQSQSQPQRPSMVGAWFCQVSSGLQLQGRRQGSRVELDQNGANGSTEKAPRAEASSAAAGGKKKRASTTSCRGGAGAAMPEATVCLLLDRFAPS